MKNKNVGVGLINYGDIGIESEKLRNDLRAHAIWALVVLGVVSTVGLAFGNKAYIVIGVMILILGFLGIFCLGQS